MILYDIRRCKVIAATQPRPLSSQVIELSPDHYLQISMVETSFPPFQMLKLSPYLSR